MSLTREFQRDRLWIFGLIVIGLVLRLDFLFASNFNIDADEAIVGLMAKHVVEGGSLPTFYYGQDYMGSFEALVVAKCFELFGISNISLKCVPLAFSILLIPLMYALGYRLGGKLAGRLASLFMAIPPASLVIWSSMARGGFIEIIFIGTLASIFAVRWLGSEKLSGVLTFTVWFLFGLGWWINNQIIYFILPFILVGFIRIVRDKTKYKVPLFLKHTGLALFSFLLGGLPYWIYNFNHDFVSLKMFYGASGSELGEHFSGLITTALPMIFGSFRFWSDSEIFPGATILGYLIYLLPVLYLAGRMSGAILKLFVLDLNRDRALLAVLGIFIATIAVFSFSHFGYLVKAPRYLLPLYVPLFALVAVFLARLHRVSPVISSVWIVAIVALNLASSYLGGRAIPGEPHVSDGERVSKDHTELIAWLNAKNIHYIKTNYWIGYRLAFETKEAVKFSVYHDPRQVRIQAYEALDRDIYVPHVLVPAQAKRIENALRALGWQYEKADLSGYSVIFNIVVPEIKTRVLAKEFYKVSATHNDESAGAAVDGDMNSRWGTAHPQEPGMRYVVRFEKSPIIAGFEYDLGTWKQDVPRGLRVEAVMENGEKKVIFNEEEHQDISYFLDWPTMMKFFFTPGKVKELRFIQTGKDPVFDWSIAELRFFTL